MPAGEQQRCVVTSVLRLRGLKANMHDGIIAVAGGGNGNMHDGINSESGASEGHHDRNSSEAKGEGKSQLA